MDNILRTALRISVLFVSACLLVWAVVPQWRLAAAGLVLGTAASIMNAVLLRRRVDLIGRIAAGQENRKVGLGLASRLATVLLAVMVSYRFPELFALPAVLAGCFFVQFAAFFAAMIHLNIRNGGKG